jgi:hypothetical protein
MKKTKVVLRARSVKHVPLATLSQVSAGGGTVEFPTIKVTAAAFSEPGKIEFPN